MFLSYRYRLYPNAEQEAHLKSTLARLCEVYNKLRSEKVRKYREEKINLSKTDLRRLALETRRNNPDLNKIHSQVVQNVAERASYAFKNFFEKRTRFPRTRKYKSYRSFTYPQSGFNVVQTERGHRLYLSGIGRIRTFIHRPMAGRVKRLTIKHEAGEWYAIFLVEREDTMKKSVAEIPEERIRGGDIGLEKFIVLAFSNR
ncbi:MAG: RNA-guided endonuclease TnpB family protein, partial [Thaumarchaeota archaeon]|nr:RNA-guided endonuclease TnpB family protein [Nitrososphaerota archaeon]